MDVAERGVQLPEACTISGLRTRFQGRQIIECEAFQSFLIGSAGISATVETPMLIKETGKELLSSGFRGGVGGSSDFRSTPLKPYPKGRITLIDGGHLLVLILCRGVGTSVAQNVNFVSKMDWLDKNRHRFDHWSGDRLPIVLRHDHDPQRLDTPTAPSEIGGIFGCHRHGWLLLLQLLQCDIRPTLAQHILHFPPINSLVRDQHQYPAIAAYQHGAAHVESWIPAPRHPVPDMSQCTSQPSYSVWQASGGVRLGILLRGLLRQEVSTI
jgi:hypothetical protein